MKREKKVENVYGYPPDAKPVLAVSSLSFTDTHGNEVKHGSVIEIESNYNFGWINGKKALVKWNKKVGLFEYVLLDRIKTYPEASGDNFHGIHSFKVVGCSDCTDLNGQNIGNMYICQHCGRSVS